jgi:hypothetical protein
MVARQISQIPGHRCVGATEQLGAINQSDVVELGAADPLRLEHPEQAGIVQVSLGFRRQMPQLLGTSDRALAIIAA